MKKINFFSKITLSILAMSCSFSSVFANTSTLIPPNLHLDGYNNSLTSIYNTLITNYPQDKVSAIPFLTQNYTDFLAQSSGLSFNSKLHQAINNFAKGFVIHISLNKANTSLFYQFASDVKAEEQNFMSIPTENGYPALPQKNLLGSYGTYRSQLVNIFVEALQQRLQDYYLPNFQNKYFNISVDRHEVPKLMNEASQLVNNYLITVKILTSHAITCDYLNTEIHRANCFRNYMQLITELPSILAISYYKDSKDKPTEYQPTEEQVESIINPIINYYKNYATSPTLIAVPVIN